MVAKNGERREIGGTAPRKLTMSMNTLNKRMEECKKYGERTMEK